MTFFFYEETVKQMRQKDEKGMGRVGGDILQQGILGEKAQKADQRLPERWAEPVQRTRPPEQRNFLLLIWPMRLLARRRGLAQRAPLVSMGLERR